MSVFIDVKPQGPTGSVDQCCLAVQEVIYQQFPSIQGEDICRLCGVSINKHRRYAPQSVVKEADKMTTLGNTVNAPSSEASSALDHLQGQIWSLNKAIISNNQTLLETVALTIRPIPSEHPLLSGFLSE